MVAQTPCIKYCIVDQNTSLCTGCGRTLDEIARWRDMTSDERLSIMATLKERMRAAGLARQSPEQR